MSNLPIFTIAIGLLLAVYGGYSAATAVKFSGTALIPAYFGAGFIALGLVALRENLRKHAMHVAALLGVIGVLGGLGMGLPKISLMMAETAPEGMDEAKFASSRNAARSQIMLGIICLIFVALCVNSFIQARRARKLSSTAP